MSAVAASLDPLTDRCRNTWMSGDFGVVARTFSESAFEFVDRLHVRPGDRILDIACGTGNQSIPAAMRGANVVGIDIAPNLIDQAKANAREENLAIRFEVADAEELPFAASGFDIVMSMFGIMFAPRPECALNEALRVLRPGGRLVVASWSPTGFIGELFRIIGKHAPPALGVPSPLLWGDQATMRERLGDHVSGVAFTSYLATLHIPVGIDEVVDYWRTYYCPTVRAFDAVSNHPERERALTAEFRSHFARFNRGGAGKTVVDAEYLEVRGIRR